MKQIAQSYRTGEMEMVSIDLPTLQPNQILIQTTYSVVSLGTEGNKVRTAKKSLVGKARSRPDLVQQVIQTAQKEGIVPTYKKVVNRLDEPISLGYSAAGKVIAIGPGVREFQVGDQVACGGENAAHGEIMAVPINLCTPIPSNVSMKFAAFATIGSIALQGIRQTKPTLGETIVVIGLGLLGQLTVQLLKANGCQVIGIDLDAKKVELAIKMGADHAFQPANDGLKNALSGITNGFGVDAVILTAATSSNDPIELAAELCRDRGRIIVVGAVNMDIPREPFYQKELDLRLSRSYGPGRYDPIYERKGIDYPIGYSRWTVQRNMAAFIYQIAEGNINLEPLITHVFPFDKAIKAYQNLMDSGDQSKIVLGVIFEYDTSQGIPLTSEKIYTQERKTSGVPNDQIGIGVIGAGSFSRKFLIPPLKTHKDIYLVGMAESNGINAQHSAKKFGFEYYSGDYHQILDDPAVNAVFIATPHNTHASIVTDSLSAGKTVYVEKPLAMNKTELAEIISAYQKSPSQPRLMVGYNRRFAPIIQKLESSFEDVQSPKIVNYRINAGYIPRDHWIQDLEIGGGRIIGEVCHFVDLVYYLVKKPISEIYARALPDQGQYNCDNLAVFLTFTDGSIGTITYVANGDSRMPKENIEVFGGGKSATIDDFRKFVFYAHGKQSVYKSSQDKGHQNEVLAIVDALKNGNDSPIPFDDLIQVAEATFGIIESINTGNPICYCP